VVIFSGRRGGVGDPNINGMLDQTAHARGWLLPDNVAGVEACARPGRAVPARAKMETNTMGTRALMPPQWERMAGTLPEERRD
jgi:hypothetical protein